MSESSEKILLDVLNQINKFLVKLKIESLDKYERKKLHDFLLPYVKQQKPLEVDGLSYDYEEVRQKYLEVFYKLDKMPVRSLFRPAQSSVDNQYDSVIIDLFLKIFLQEEKEKTSQNPPVILSINRLTAEDLEKLGVEEKRAATSASGATSTVITPSSPHSTASNPLTVPASSPKRKTMVTFGKDVKDHRHEDSKNMRSLRQKLQKIIDMVPPHDVEIVYWKFFTKRDISYYPPAAIKVALDFVVSHYPENGPYHRKIATLKKEVESMENIQAMLSKITEAREGTGFGRLNAALKRIEAAIKNNEKIDLSKIKQAMDDHDPAKHNVLKRLFF